MASAISKRQQARNERILQDLIRSVPGNDRCADCSAKNPGWASWNLGVFLCMRCAALHRKLGTHVSKVKSLSMDSWSSEQVENMRRVGNAESNRSHNPKGVKAQIPIDVDEVDGVMERFIRQKYEARILAEAGMNGGRAVSAARQDTGSTSTGSMGDEPPPLPPKPGKKFGFSLRSASSTFPRPHKQDRFTPPISPTYSGNARYGGPPSPPKSKPSQLFGMKITSVSNNFDQKLASLRDMGFSDTRRNSEVLKGSDGNLDRAVEALVQMGEGSKPAAVAESPDVRALTPVSMSGSGTNGITVDKRREPEKKTQTDPWEIREDPPPQRSATAPVPNAALPPRSQSAAPPTSNWNPFLQAPTTRTQTLETSLQDMAVSPTTMAPPQQPQGNPWQQLQQPQQQPVNPWGAQQSLDDSIYGQPYQQYQQPAPMQSQNTGNPFLRTSRSQVFTTSNPWAPTPTPPPQTMSPQQTSNPFGAPWQQPQQQQAPNAFQQNATQYPATIYGQQPDFFATQQQQQQQQQQNPQNFASNTAHNPFLQQQQPQQLQQPQQPQQQHQFIQTAQQQQPQQQPFQQPQPFPQQSQTYPQPQTQGPQQQQQQFQPQQQQLPARHDKSSILALYGHPQLAPQRPLQTLPEDGVPGNQQPQPQQAQFPGAPQGQFQAQQQQQRSVTMPIQQVAGDMNPFAAAGGMGGGVRHVSNESRDFQGWGAGGGGRSSPDAFAGLSARYAR